jgi:hypothetical protein
MGPAQSPNTLAQLFSSTNQSPDPKMILIYRTFNFISVLILFTSLMIAGCQQKTVNPENISSAKGKPASVHKKEFARILYRMSGCFGSDKCELIIYNQDLAYVATLKRLGQKDITKTVSAENISDITLFISKLKKYKSARFCTTEESFDVAYGGEVFSNNIGGCDFDNFYLLLRKMQLENISG